MRIVHLLAVVVAACWLSAVGAADAADPLAQRPNIVLIMADDLGIEALGSYGGQSYRTPHLDRLARAGLRFTHAYAQPLCTPTRLQVMTGKYNHRNWRCFGVLDPAESTFGHLLRSAGYRTCIAGKWQLYSYDPPDYPGAASRRGIGMHPRDSGFETYMLFHSLHTEDKGSRYANPTFLRDGQLHQNVEGAYGEDLSVEFIAEFLRRHRDEPMFVYYPMALPHWPMVPTPRSAIWADPARRLEEDLRYFPDMVEYLDELVGRLIDHIEQLGLAERTLVLFYSDNGTDRRITSQFRGRQVVGGKGETTQNGIRVPLVAWWPGTVAPGVCHDLVDSTDLLPTLAELAGKPTPADWAAEGVSFVPALRGHTDRQSRSWCYFWHDPRPGWDKEQRRRDIFALDHHYKLYSDGRLFDISGDAFHESLLEADEADSAARQARAKLQAVIDSMLQPPLSPAALADPIEFGRP